MAASNSLRSRIGAIASKIEYQVRDQIPDSSIREFSEFTMLQDDICATANLDGFLCVQLGRGNGLPKRVRALGRAGSEKDCGREFVKDVALINSPEFFGSGTLHHDSVARRKLDFSDRAPKTCHRLNFTDQAPNRASNTPDSARLVCAWDVDCSEDGLSSSPHRHPACRRRLIF